MSKVLFLSSILLLFYFQIFAQNGDEKIIHADLRFFESPLALKLKKGVNKKQIESMKNSQLRQVATQLFRKSYDYEYRYATYHAVLDPTALGHQLWIGDGYSKYENVTGIYLPKGKHVVLVDKQDADQISLVVPNWMRMPPDQENPTEDPNGWGLHSKSFELKNGINIIELKDWDGLAYIQFFKNSIADTPSVKIHFPAAAVNGYFDKTKHGNAEWSQLLDSAVFPIMDGLGTHIQIAYPVQECKKYAYNLGVELVSNYDSLVYLQHKLMGLVKYNKVPRNRILSRVNYNYYMFRDHDGVAYMGGKSGFAMDLVVNPRRVIKGDPCWGFAHEVGHVHQLGPFFNWGGLGEVSNNVFSLFVNTHFGTKSRIQVQNNYQKARDNIINNKISYLQDEDVFNRLVPFWQLHLYFSKIEKNEDFYPDLFEALRNYGDSLRITDEELVGGGWDNRGQNPAEFQLLFTKIACEVSQVDLTDFFDQYGFFHVGEFNIEDYGSYNYNMTLEMVEKCKSEIKAMKLTNPKIDISTLTDVNTI